MTENISIEQQDYIEGLLNNSRQELLDTLGLEIQKGALFSDETGNIEVGKGWFRKNKAKIAELICPMPFVREYMDSPSKERQIGLIATIADIISQQWLNIPVFVVAVLIVKEGLHHLCEGHDVSKQISAS